MRDLIISRNVAALALVAGLAGCAGDGYYRQSIGGHLELMRNREDIADVLARPDISDEVRRRLELITDLVDYAHERLALPDNGSYRAVVDVGRPFVAWNVVAVPPLSLDPVPWCFPVVGCVVYRGYFAEEDAEAFAAGLRAEGLDVAVLGTRAYSTLGWFDDPVPTTILFEPDYELAAVIFHELSHQRVYIAGDSTFNESYASAVERIATEQWLAEFGTPDLRAGYRRHRARQEAFLDLLLGTRAQLAALFASGLDEAAMLTRKAAIFDAMRADYARLRSSWGGYAGYDGFFADDLNNAKLALVSAYNSRVEAFVQLFAESGNDWVAFHAAVEALAALPDAERNAVLDALADRGA